MICNIVRWIIYKYMVVFCELLSTASPWLVVIAMI